jgi:hypothetical protein
MSIQRRGDRSGCPSKRSVRVRTDTHRYACPDMTGTHSAWGKALAEKYCVQTNVLHFYVTQQGELFYG